MFSASEKISDSKEKTFFAVSFVFVVVSLPLDQTNVTDRSVIRGGVPGECGLCHHNRGNGHQDHKVQAKR